MSQLLKWKKDKQQAQASSSTSSTTEEINKSKKLENSLLDSFTPVVSTKGHQVTNPSLYLVAILNYISELFYEYMLANPIIYSNHLRLQK